MASIDYYDRYAVPYYEETVNLSMEEQLQSFMELLPENGEVLDLGCGSGRDTLFLEEEGFSVTAMDGSKRMCELAEIHTGRDVLHLRVEDMEFDDVFHGIWACSVLGHFAPNKIHEVLEFFIFQCVRAKERECTAGVITVIMTEIPWMTF